MFKLHKSDGTAKSLVQTTVVVGNALPTSPLQDLLDQSTTATQSVPHTGWRQVGLTCFSLILWSQIETLHLAENDVGLHGKPHQGTLYV